jgi:hypothetical protein
MMAGGVLVLAWFCLMIGLGVVAPAVSSMVKSVGGLVGSITHIVASPSPSPTGSVTDAPTIDPPDQAVTNAASVDLTVRIPPAVVGLKGYTCRLYVTLPKGQPTVVTEVPVGATAQLVLSNLTLAKGENDFTASVVGPGGESAQSAPVAITLDVTKPPITITSPKNGSSVTKPAVTVKGKTQAASSVRVQDDANGATVTVTADDTGAFSAPITVAAGPNNLTVTVTDPAGNGNTATVSVTLGAGALHVNLTGTTYQFNSKRLPTNVTFTAVVIGADGKRVPGATALFTVSVPGLQPVVSSPVLTNSSGSATFSTAIPKGAMAGSGLATVLITMPTGTQTATDRAVLTVK